MSEKTVQITIEIECDESIRRSDLIDWLNGHIDNIPFEELDVDEDLIDSVSINGVY